MSSKIGCGYTLAIGTVSCLALTLIIGVAKTLPILIVGVICLGFGTGIADISMNGQAVLCEKMNRTPTLGLFHSFYSIGGIAGALYGGMMLQVGQSLINELLILGGILLIPSLLFKFWLFSFDEEKLIHSQTEALLNHSLSLKLPLEYEENSLSRRHNKDDDSNDENDIMSKILLNDTFVVLNNDLETIKDPYEKLDSDIVRTTSTCSNISVLKDKYLLYKLCIGCFISYFGEGSIGDWSAIYLSENGASPFTCTLGYVGFQAFVAIGRYYSDVVVDMVSVGRVNLLIASGVISCIGLVLVVISASLSDDYLIVVAIIGFSICGIGLSSVAPSVISLAGSEIPQSVMTSSESIGYVSSVGYLGIMTGPPLLGGFSTLVGGLRWSFLLDSIGMILL